MSCWGLGMGTERQRALLALGAGHRRTRPNRPATFVDRLGCIIPLRMTTIVPQRHNADLSLFASTRLVLLPLMVIPTFVALSPVLLDIFSYSLA